MVLLRDESAHGLDPRALLRVAALAAPWSSVVTWGVVLGRRSALLADDERSLAAVSEVVERLQASSSATRWRTAAARVRGSLRPARLLTWRLAWWLVGLLPAATYLVVGGFPATHGLQRAMAGSAGTWALALGLVAAAAWSATSRSTRPTCPRVDTQALARENGLRRRAGCGRRRAGARLVG